jgi:hypothetical protein
VREELRTSHVLSCSRDPLGIESLQKTGTKFLCNNALGIWCLEPEARGKGKASEISK